MTHYLIQLMIEGIEQGAIYALWALAYALVYQVLGLMNFAFGDSLLLSAYVMIALVATSGLSPWVALAIAIGVAAVVSMLIERQVYSRFIGKGQGEAGFIAALACAYILRNIATVMLGNEPQTFPTLFNSNLVSVAGYQLSSGGLIVLGLCVATMVAFALFLRSTKVGRGIVLAGQDRAAAAIVGIPVRKVITIVYGVSGALGLIGAVMFGDLYHGLNSTTGFYITFQAFIAATVGGAGSLLGAVVGGLALGVIESLAVGYVSGNFAQALAWSAMALIALISPRGLLGRRVVERV
ncbi:MAG: branched-chain amino acid ABC transporter permease [Nitrospiraceae bacterium]|nr:branched-chain amino acid ABC transporter permease [Nitrospiraceae bacterium]